MVNIQKRLVIAMVCIVIAAGLSLGLASSKAGRALQLPSADAVAAKVLGNDTALQSRLLVVGDIFWGRRMYDWSQASPLKQKYPFSRLGEFQPELYDAWVANLECPSVPEVKPHTGYNNTTLTSFNCDSTFL